LLLYENHVRDEFERVKGKAVDLRKQFAANTPVGELNAYRANLADSCRRLKAVLPSTITTPSAGPWSKLQQHLHFMNVRLDQGSAAACKQDIEDICESDLPAIEADFYRLFTDQANWDRELAKEVSIPLAEGRLASAVRDAFVILKSRLVHKFGALEAPGRPSLESLDGSALVNRIFGSKDPLASTLDEAEREAMRNLLAGLYGTFRNHYAHNQPDASWHEVDAILSMINTMLKRVDRYKSTP